MTKKQQQQSQDARVFAALYMENGPATAMKLADNAGDPNLDAFCTEGAARAALKRFINMGLVEELEEPIKVGRKRLKGFQLTHLGREIGEYCVYYAEYQ